MEEAGYLHGRMSKVSDMLNKHITELVISLCQPASQSDPSNVCSRSRGY